MISETEPNQVTFLLEQLALSLSVQKDNSSDGILFLMPPETLEGSACLAVLDVELALMKLILLVFCVLQVIKCRATTFARDARKPLVSSQMLR